MADIEFAGANPKATVAPAAVQGGVLRAVNIVGGIVSIALIAGLGYWGYDLMRRDMTRVPVVKAFAGPIRVAPEDPGGQLAHHQGLAVNEVVGTGEAAEPPVTVILAPDPVTLLAEDLPQSALRVEPDVTAPDVPESTSAIDDAVAEAMEGDNPLSDPLAFADALAEGVEPLSGTQTAALADPALGGVFRSPRPPRRPATRIDAASVEALSAPAVRDVSIDDILPGTNLVQLGAFDSADVARRQWFSIADRFAVYFDGKGRVVQEVRSGERTFWRLRAEGFVDLDDARRFCSVLAAEDAECIPLVVR